MTTIRPLAVHDIPAAQRLREQAGWNQTDHDWRRLLAWSPDGCWAAERHGRVVGTTTVTTYGRRIAWVGMVLVDEAHRRQGIGRALLRHALDHLDRLGIETIALDSTPEGQPLYASLGFTDAFELARWRGPIPPDRSPWERGDLRRPGEAAPDVESLSRAPRGGGRAPSADEHAIRPFAPADLPAVATYDAQLFGTDRAHILEALYSSHPDRCFVAEQVGQTSGYVLSRPGARARHLGPLAASNAQTAERLVRLARPPVADASTSEMVMDLVMPNASAVDLATVLGLTQVRRFIRMTRGAPPPEVDATRLYTSAGPELG